MSNYAVIVYKEVGKDPEFRKIEKTNEVFESLVDGEIDFITYDTYCIVFKKNQEGLKPNIYLNTNQLGFEKTLRGTVFAINRNSETNEYLTLNKEQAFKCRKLFIDEAFDYSNYDENGNYVGKKKKNKNKNKNKNIIPNNNQNIIPVNPVPFNPMQSIVINNPKNGTELIEQLSKIPGVRIIPIKDENNPPKIDENQNKEINSTQTTNSTKPTLEQLNSILNSKKDSDSDDDNDDFDRDTTLRLVLSIQSAIIKWIKDNYNY